MTLREASKRAWSARSEIPTETELKLGALLRIADATEKMVTKVNELEMQRDMYKQFCEENRRRPRGFYAAT